MRLIMREYIKFYVQCHGDCTDADETIARDGDSL